MLGHKNQLYVGTSSGAVEVHDSENDVLLQQFTMHVSGVHNILKLPVEIHQCICAELFPMINHKLAISDYVSSRLSDIDDVTPKERSLQEYALQKSSSQSPSHLSYPAPLIVSIGDGLANWLGIDGEEKTADSNLEFLTWAGYGHL